MVEHAGGVSQHSPMDYALKGTVCSNSGTGHMFVSTAYRNGWHGILEWAKS